MSEKKKTFFKKNPLVCPVCKTKVFVEELFTGRGRVIAGNHTIELRRTYQESATWGKANPLLYPVAVCPQCYFSVIQEDFERKITNQDNLNRIRKDKTKKLEIESLFDEQIDFAKERTLISGTLSHIFADLTYNYLPDSYNPTFKKALSSLRAAWLLGDLEIEDKDEKEKYEKMKNFYYEQSARLYKMTLDYEQNGKEPLELLNHAGPDLDKNFGFEGIKYMYCILNYRMCFFEKVIEERVNKFNYARSLLGKLFGFGKTSKGKPSVILELAKRMYRVIGDKVKEYEHKIENNIPITEDYIELELVDLDED